MEVQLIKIQVGTSKIVSPIKYKEIPSTENIRGPQFTFTKYCANQVDSVYMCKEEFK